LNFCKIAAPGRRARHADILVSTEIGFRKTGLLSVRRFLSQNLVLHSGYKVAGNGHRKSVWPVTSLLIEKLYPYPDCDKSTLCGVFGTNMGIAA